jgi:hypothetical protein
MLFGCFIWQLVSLNCYFWIPFEKFPDTIQTDMK